MAPINIKFSCKWQANFDNLMKESSEIYSKQNFKKYIGMVWIVKSNWLMSIYIIFIYFVIDRNQVEVEIFSKNWIFGLSDLWLCIMQSKNPVVVSL